MEYVNGKRIEGVMPMSKTIKLFEMFSGFGGASFALKKAGIDFECVGFSEIDKFAIQCYEQNHCFKFPDCLRGEVIRPPNFGDCTKIDPNDIPNFDLLTGGFPCQSFSTAGKGLGELDTRGTLFNEIIRIAEVKQPKYMLLENVKGLTNKKHKATFEKILSELKRIGYNVHWEILNSKNYGIPQNRNRIFFMCCRRDLVYTNNSMTFPEKEELKIFLKDILEDDVDEKYYLKQEQIDRILNSTFHQEKLRIQDNKISSTLLARDYKDPKCVRITGFYDKPGKTHQAGSIYDKEMISPALDTAQGGNRQPFIATSKGLIKDDIFSIRKLTPTEYFRLMGFLNDEINLIGLSNSQRYKIAGNGFDVNLVSKIFKEMFL